MSLRLQRLVTMKYILFSGGPIIKDNISLHFNKHKAVHYRCTLLSAQFILMLNRTDKL